MQLIITVEADYDGKCEELVDRIEDAIEELESEYPELVVYLDRQYDI